MIMITMVFGLTLYANGSALAADGKQLFDFYCAQCHGLTGKGDGPNVTEHFKTDPRNFTNVTEMKKLSKADVKTVIADGGAAISKSQLMPPWSKTISAADIDKIAAYVWKLCKCEGK
jgi:cytochrome c oxidase cbb3-type subunit 3